MEVSRNCLRKTRLFFQKGIFLLWIWPIALKCTLKEGQVENSKTLVSFLKEWQLIKKKTPKQVFSGEYCEIFKNSFFIEHLCGLFLKVGNSLLYKYCFPSLLKCFFLQQNIIFKILPCCNTIYLLWDLSILK